MFIKRFQWHVIFCSFIFLSMLSGCAEVQIEHQSDALNRASGTMIAEHVLLNVVRASLDLPMSFTRLQKYTSQGMVNGTLAPRLPFGPAAVKSFDVGPTLNLNSGVFQSDYVDVSVCPRRC